MRLKSLEPTPTGLYIVPALLRSQERSVAQSCYNVTILTLLPFLFDQTLQLPMQEGLAHFCSGFNVGLEVTRYCASPLIYKLVPVIRVIQTQAIPSLYTSITGECHIAAIP